ncbi:hypothetical protein F5Y06DRAFT_170334 [Hypoxylon sp. FL0890]|nr:hypothetical protein F5Y06DRAFT_170334 [Hypoxylon sp. FL0890]
MTSTPTKMPAPLPNCPAKGTNRRECELTWKILPNLDELESSLSQMTSAFDWDLPEEIEPPTKHNIYLRNLDQFINDFESHRENDTLEEFKSNCLRPEFAALPDNVILKKVAELAQTRALFINYLLATRVSPVMHREAFDVQGPLTDQTGKRAIAWSIKRDQIAVAKKATEAFWGKTDSGNPLPDHRHKAMGISAYENWADPIDKKLADMCPRLEDKYKSVDWNVWGPEKVQELF